MNKYVCESLHEFNDYKFFRVFEEKDEKEDLKDKEQQGLDVVEKCKKDFEAFKKDAKGEILKYKEFWELNKQTKEGFSEDNGNIYKLFGSDYVVGVLKLPAETLSDGSIDGGMGATEEPEEEIIEGKVLEAEGEEEDLDLDLNLDDDVSDTETPSEAPIPETPEAPIETPAETPETPETPETSEAPAETTIAEPQTYLVVYSLTGDDREEIFRCGSNNAVNAFNAFYNDTFKGSMKDAILNYKQQKEIEKSEVEKAEKTKAQSEKESKIKKFLA